MYLLQYNTSFSVNKCTSVSKASVYMFVFTVHSGSTNHWMWYLAIFFFYPITNKIYSFKNTLLVHSDATRNLKTKVQSNWSLMLSNKCSAGLVQSTIFACKMKGERKCKYWNGSTNTSNVYSLYLSKQRHSITGMEYLSTSWWSYYVTVLNTH